MGRVKILTALFLTSILAGTGVAAYARNCEFGPGPETGFHIQRLPHEPPFHELKLTDEQQSQLEIWRQEKMEKNDIRMEAIREISREMYELMTAEAIDEVAVRTKATELANAHADAAIEQAYFMQRARSILTPEQLEELEALKEQHRKHLKEMLQFDRSSWR